MENKDPEPPSSQMPSFTAYADAHVLEHAWPETIPTCKSMSAEKARASIFARCLIGALLAATGRNLCYGIFCITSTTNTEVPPHGAFHAAGAPSPRNTPCIKLRRARSCVDWARIHHPDSRAAPYMENVHRLIVEGCNLLCARGGVRACGALCERRIPCMHPLC